jgi:hypothetical protein
MRPTHTLKNCSQIDLICRLGDELVDSILNTERLVQLSCNRSQRSVSRLFSAPALHVDANAESGWISDRGLRRITLYLIEFELTGSPGFGKV